MVSEAAFAGQPRSLHRIHLLRRCNTARFFEVVRNFTRLLTIRADSLAS
jgi:hypothetical protein